MRLHQCNGFEIFALRNLWGDGIISSQIILIDELVGMCNGDGMPSSMVVQTPCLEISENLLWLIYGINL